MVFPMFNTNFAPEELMSEATNKVIYLCLVFFLRFYNHLCSRLSNSG